MTLSNDAQLTTLSVANFGPIARSEGGVTPAIGIYWAKQHWQILYGGADLCPAPFFLLSTVQTLECGEHSLPG